MSTNDEKFKELEKRIEQSDIAGGPDKIGKHHKAGKMTARERVQNFWMTAHLKK